MISDVPGNYRSTIHRRVSRQLAGAIALTYNDEHFVKSVQGQLSSFKFLIFPKSFPMFVGLGDPASCVTGTHTHNPAANRTLNQN